MRGSVDDPGQGQTKATRGLERAAGGSQQPWPATLLKGQRGARRGACAARAPLGLARPAGGWLSQAAVAFTTHRRRSRGR
jgi:hypothetical protein